MKIMVVYDSYFGNTKQIAYAIGNSFDLRDDVGIFAVGEVGPEQFAKVDYLIVGSPTRAFRPSGAISDFLQKIPGDGLKGVKVAAFDTRISTDDIGSRILGFFIDTFGYAAGPIAKKLEKKGGKLVMHPEGFFVEDKEGPLKDGEVERAAAWAKLLTKT